MNAATVLIIVMIVVIMASMFWKPNAALCAIAPVAAIFFMLMRNRRDVDGFVSPDGPETLTLSDESAPDPALDTCRETSPPDAWHPKRAEGAAKLLDPARLMAIKQINAAALNELYGRRYAGPIDDAIWAHKQRIGDRDHQATINQVRGRRNNVYEPYFRQELNELNSIRWWEPETALIHTSTPKQMDSIDMGRDMLRDTNVDGIYGPI